MIKEKTNNCMNAEIINASYVGNSYQYVVSSSVGELFIVSNETTNHFKLNEEVFITFDESGVTILED
jgi:iron(III) transport system ATP-binding protein